MRAALEKELSALRPAHESLQVEKDRVRADNKEKHSKASHGVGRGRLCVNSVTGLGWAQWG